MADAPFEGLSAYLLQGKNHQVLFMEFEKDVEVPEHSHEDQWAAVLAGRIDLSVEGVTTTYQKGDTYFIPGGTNHSAKIYAGYVDITFFNQPDKFNKK